MCTGCVLFYMNWFKIQRLYQLGNSTKTAHFWLFVCGAKMYIVLSNWAPCINNKKTFFVCWSQILHALLIFAKFPIFALFPLPPCNWLRNCASDKFGHFFWHQMHHLSNTAQLWEKRHYRTKKKLLFFAHNVEF